MLFTDLSLIEPLLRALEAEGYERPTPIQQQAIPPVLEGRDLLGCAQTGTGKTAAFALPMLQLLHNQKPSGSVPPQSNRRPIRALILTPTRELALQISESFTAYGRNLHLRNTVIFGGVGQTPQTDALRRGTDILVATPGRLLDLMNQGFVDLRQLSIFVLDEADRMLDMGFIHDVRKVIAKLPTQRQTLFFSATMPPEIATLADSILHEPVKVEVAPPATTAELVQQKIFFVHKADKKNLLIHLMKDPAIKSALIFTRTKHGANRVAGDLTKAGIRAEAIHGNKSQSARVAALGNFKNGRNRALVATDIAARGIDIDELSHVINFELPNVPETYVHRIGRTGRAGASGVAFSFCEAEELPYLRDIQKITGQIVPVETDHPYAADLAAPGLPAPRMQPNKKQKGQSGRPQHSADRRTSGSAESEDPRPAPISATIPLPSRRDDRDFGGSRNRKKNRRPNGQPSGNGQTEQRSTVSGGGNRQESSFRPQRQDNRRPEQTQRPERQDNRRPEQTQRPERQDNRRPEQTQRPERPQRPNVNPGAQKAEKMDMSNEMRRRFSSILEVSSIEKQDYKRKPKPRFEDRPSEPTRERGGKDQAKGGQHFKKRR
ncbi:MAG: DEAD/DEAH box helicase [Saprospiraceae bacterium]|nr:DEAD/DEAH box helicase [Saprospiraceae bacterium]